jgi:tripartite-type tricarboxylate transporter receptor subunit TctC
MRNVKFAALVALVAVWLVFPVQAQAPRPPASLAGQTITIVEPFGQGSVTDTVMRILKPGMEQSLGAKVQVVTERGPDGSRAFDRVAAAKPDGLTLLAITDAARLFYEFLSAAKVKLETFTPIAKLTDGVSLSLVAPATSPVRDYKSLKAMLEAKKRPTLALYGTGSPAGVFAAMVEDHASERFGERFVETDAEILARLADGKAAFGILPTSALLGSAGQANKLRAMLTSGARRNPSLPNVPTLAEATGKAKLSFTMAVVLFAPPGTPSPVAETLTKAVASAANSAEAKTAAQAAALPLAYRDAATLRSAMDRNQRVIRDLLTP